ncbi:MAG: hypothetical protein AAF108_09170 [Planctomycetota bacterium]
MTTDDQQADATPAAPRPARRRSVPFVLGSLGAVSAAGGAQGSLLVHGVDNDDADNPRLFRVDIATGAFEWIGSVVDGIDVDTLAALNLSDAMSADAAARGSAAGFQRPALSGAPGDASGQPIDLTEALHGCVCMQLDPESGRWHGFVPGTGFVSVDPASGERAVLLAFDVAVADFAHAGGGVIHALCGTRLVTIDPATGTQTADRDLAEHLDGFAPQAIAIAADGRVCCSTGVTAGEMRVLHVDLASGRVEVHVLRGLPLQHAGSVSMSGVTPPPASLMMVLSAAVTAAGLPRKINGVGTRG